MVSGNRPVPTSDHQKKPALREVGLAVITSDTGISVCSCGWLVRAEREKVREDAVDRHLDKKHNGRGIRL